MTDDGQEPPGVTISEFYRSVGVTFRTLVAIAPSMKKCIDLAQKAARTEVSVLLIGENGTGKNLIAQAIHNDSQRRGKPFIATNCSALTDTLVESELFGHERGAFTSAETSRRGRFELAHKGTLFLDEIGDLTQNAQAKLLRAVEYREFERVGGEATIHIDVRLIGATNRDLNGMVERGEFRQDLLYRLNEMVIEVPPLRDRVEEISVLAQRFVKELASKYYMAQAPAIEPAVLRTFQRHLWPGNVRELRGVIKRALSICDGPIITLDHIDLRVQADDVPERMPVRLQTRSQQVDSEPATPSEPVPAAVDDPGQSGAVALSLAEVERAHIERVLKANRWQKKAAARVLGISRPTLDRKIELYRIEIPER
jgi:Nif-specific regulatory protein